MIGATSRAGAWTTGSSGTLVSLLAVVSLTLPWLTTRASGPSPSVEPWLLSALCAAVFVGLGPVALLRGRVAAALGALALWAWLWTGPSIEVAALAAGGLLIYLVACGAAGRAGTPGAVSVIAWAWLLAGAVSTAIALLQYFGLSDALGPLVSTSSLGEAYGNLRQRNQFASLTVIASAAALWLGLQARSSWVAWPAIIWLAIGNAATTSRTGLLELLVLTALVAVDGWRGRAVRLCLTALAAYALAAVALPLLLEWATGLPATSLWRRVADLSSCSSRRVLWSNVLHLISLKPWTGWGWGELDYAHYMTLYPDERFCDILDNAHSLPLQLAVELGIPAAAALCLAAAWLVVQAQPWRETDPTRRLAWGVLAVLAIHSLLEYPLWYGPFQIALGLSLGLLWHKPAASAAAAAVRFVLPGLLALGAAYAAWDYHRVSQVYLPPDERAPRYQQDTLGQARRSWLFVNQARFAELTVTPLTRANAAWMLENAEKALHYSPEPRVVEKLVESAALQGRESLALVHLARFRAAFPEDYEAWAQRNARPVQGAR